MLSIVRTNAALANFKMRHLICMLLVMSTHPLCAFALPTIDRAAKLEFDRCIKETSDARNACTFGGCGNILASCYERQIDIIQSDTERQMNKFSSTRCSQQAEQLTSNFDSLLSRTSGLQSFQGSWSGFELSVQTELLKNHALHMLAKECGT